MFKKLKNKISAKKNGSKIENTTDNSFILSKSLEENISHIKELFIDDDTLIVRNFENAENKDIQFSILFTDGMISSSQLNDNIIKPLLQYKSFNSKLNIMDSVMSILFSPFLLIPIQRYMAKFRRLSRKLAMMLLIMPIIPTSMAILA